MKGETQETFFVGAVVVTDAILNIEEDARFRRLLVVRKSVDDALLRGDEDAVAAVPGVRQYERPKRIRLARLGFAFPIGPFQIGESDGRFERQRLGIDFTARNDDWQAGHGAGLHVGNQQILAGRIEADVGRILESLGQENWLRARFGDDENFAFLVVADKKPAVMVPDQAIGGSESFSHFFR